MIKIETDKAIKDFKDLGKQLSQKQLAKGLSRAINRSMMQGRTVARRKVASIYNIPQRALTESVALKASTSNTLTAYIQAGAKTLPLTTFAPQFDTPTKSLRVTKRGEMRVRDRTRKGKNTGNGVSFEIYKGKRERLPFAFMTPKIKSVFGRGKYASRGFERRNKRVKNKGNDLPIQSLSSVSVHTAVINKSSLSAIQSKVADVLPRELQHELNYRLGKIKPTSTR
ncbi:phage tail protein [Foetidibacter luteolus]|uniref:phage tail protein n=1 Tax=Foetidibacter luteolus TaxID=2608880 RepID=UPI00129A3F05|nr:phage tail protein [Foetidibacter luteolus]